MAGKVVALIASLLMFAPHHAWAQEGTAVVITLGDGPLQEIPRYRDKDQKNEYSSWTIFVICNQRWVGNKKSLSRIKDQFIRFGTAIGKNDLAIWPETKSRQYDFNVGARYCKELKDRLKLDELDSPYLVTTTKWPGSADGLRDYNLVTFGNEPPSITEDLLTELTNQVLSQRFDQSRLDTNGLYHRLRSAGIAFIDAMAPIARRVSVKIVTPFFELFYTPPK